MNILERLSFNQMAVKYCSGAGVSTLAVWRHKLGGDAAKAAAMIRGEGLHVSSLCRGGWFSAPTAGERRRRVADNRVAIEEAATLGAPVLVIVSGPANGQTLSDARATVLDGLMEVLPDAEKAGVVLGVEPLHPMYAAERSVVVTLRQANDLVDRLASKSVGVVVDAFHVWWDPELMEQIERARGLWGFMCPTGRCRCRGS
jgi:sugar phosphate isomerase/epimerase